MKMLNVKDLKIKADDLGIPYPKNSTTIQMEKIIKDYEALNPAVIEKKDGIQDISEKKGEQVMVDKGTLDNMMARLTEMENKQNAVSDQNKVKAYEKGKEKRDNFAFSLKLYPTPKGDYPIISRKMPTEYMALDPKDTVQDLVVTYIKDGKEVEANPIPYIDFTKFLKRSDKILADSMTNLDGSPVSIVRDLNPETKKDYYVMRPTGRYFNVTLTYNGNQVTILSKYLNA